jgi:hypothetical protein
MTTPVAIDPLDLIKGRRALALMGADRWLAWLFRVYRDAPPLPATRTARDGHRLGSAHPSI